MTTSATAAPFGPASDSAPAGWRGEAELRPPMGRPTPPKRRRRPALLLAGIALVVVGALGAVWLVQSVGDRVDVVGVAHDVAYGEKIGRDDLTRVQISADPALKPIAWSDVDSVVGQTATSTLAAGSLLTEANFTADAVPGEGKQLIGLELKTAQLPLGALRPGDDVLLVVTPTPGSVPQQEPGSEQTPDAGVAGTLLSITGPSPQGAVNVNVVVDEQDGAAVATAAANGELSIVLVAQGDGD